MVFLSMSANPYDKDNMPKIDLKKELKALYNPPRKPVLVEAPSTSYLMIDGLGDPAISKEYAESVEALFPLAYTLKFMIKKRQGFDYGVMPLEGLWWADDLAHFMDDRSKWQWTSMIMQPEQVTPELVREAMEQVEKKKSPPALSKVRFEQLDEGLAAQVMHVGPFSEEGPTVDKLHAFIDENGYTMSGKHHEIYLNDVRKAAPGKDENGHQAAGCQARLNSRAILQVRRRLEDARQVYNTSL
jgi:Uncharacterized conserved protein